MNKTLDEALEVIGCFTKQIDVSIDVNIKGYNREKTVNIEANLGHHPTLGGDRLLRVKLISDIDTKPNLRVDFDAFHRPYEDDEFEVGLWHASFIENDECQILNRFKGYIERCLKRIDEEAFLTNVINFKTPEHLIPMLKLAINRGYIRAANIETGEGMDYRVHLNTEENGRVTTIGEESEQYLAFLFREKGITFDARFLRDAFDILSNTTAYKTFEKEVLVQKGLNYLTIEKIRGMEAFYRLDFAETEESVVFLETAYVNFNDLIKGTFKQLVSFFSHPCFEKVKVQSELSSLAGDVFNSLNLSQMDATWAGCELEIVPGTMAEGLKELRFTLNQNFYFTFYRPLGTDFINVGLFFKSVGGDRKIHRFLCSPVDLSRRVLEIKKDLDFKRYEDIIKKCPIAMTLCGDYLYPMSVFNQNVVQLDLYRPSDLHISIPLMGREGAYTTDLQFKPGVFQYLITNIAKSGVLSNEQLTLEQRLNAIDAIVASIEGNKQLTQE